MAHSPVVEVSVSGNVVTIRRKRLAVVEEASPTSLRTDVVETVRIEFKNDGTKADSYELPELAVTSTHAGRKFTSLIAVVTKEP